MKNQFRHHLSFTVLPLGLALATAVQAQDFNVDVGQTISTNPAGAYGGAAGQPGWWSWLQPIPASTQPLQNLAGGGTPVSVNIAGGVGGFSFNNAATFGDDERLMDDLLDVGPAGATVVWTFDGLVAGGYWVYTYAWAPDDDDFRTRVHVDGAEDPDQDIGAAWPGAQKYLDTFALHFVVLSPGEDLVVRTMTVLGSGSVNGFQLVTGGCDGRLHEYCTGKLNSAGCVPDIAGVGVPSASAGFGFHVTAALVPPNKTGFLVYSVTGPAHIPFAGATLCLAAPQKRSTIQNSGPGGACGGDYDIDFNAYAHAPGADPALVVAGTSVWCQYYYRDPTHVDGTGVGLSNALRFTMCF